MGRIQRERRVFRVGGVVVLAEGGHRHGDHPLGNETDAAPGVGVVGRVRLPPMHGGSAGELEHGPAAEVHEQERRSGIGGEIAEAVEHVVAGVVRPPKVLPHNADEPSGATAMGSVVSGAGVGGAQKEGVGGLYEANVVVSQSISSVQLHSMVVRRSIDGYAALLDVL